MFKLLRNEIVCVIEYISYLVFLLPRMRAFNYIKSVYLRLFFRANIGSRVVFYPGIWIFTGRELVLGSDVDLATGVLLTTDGGLQIGDRVLVGYGTKILTSNHRVPPLPEIVFSSGHEKKAVVIEKDVWIGANCIILPGVTIGQGSVIAAGSVVTKSVPSNTVFGGVPARFMRKRT